jgi:hypothetical protein
VCDTRFVVEPTMNRRQLLGLLGSGAVSLALVACAKKIEPGSSERLPGTAEDGDPLWSPEAKAYIVAVPTEAQAEGDRVYPVDLRGRATNGIMALKAKCPNDGIRVSWCRGDRFFSCTGCGSVFTRYGDCIAGPSPRGLDRLGLSVSAAGDVVIDRSVVINGPPTGTAIEPKIDPATACQAVLPPA